MDPPIPGLALAGKPATSDDADWVGLPTGRRGRPMTSVMVVEDDPAFLNRFCKIVVADPDFEFLITVFGDEKHVLASIEAGATGYLLKSSLPEEFVDQIKQLVNGGSPISPLIARQLLRRFAGGAPGTPMQALPAAAETGLSPRETEVLSLITKGFSFAEIARLLAVSPHTFTAHVKKLAAS